MTLPVARIRRMVLASLVLAAVVMPVVARGACTRCVLCPNRADDFRCFTSSDAGSAVCFGLNCGTGSNGSAICGQPPWDFCASIDGVPVSTRTATATATATATGTATSTGTATATATATGTATHTPTATPVPQGGACSTPSQCSTLQCADGVCCDTACDGRLEQCNLPGQVGTCATTAAAAPAASSTGLLAMMAVLIGAAFVAMRWRRA